MLEDFKNWLSRNEANSNDINFIAAITEQFIEWYQYSFNIKLERLRRVNVLDYCSYLQNKMGYSVSKINGVMFALSRFDMFLTLTGRQANCALGEKDFMFPRNHPSINVDDFTESNLTEREVEAFCQLVLCETGLRNYAIVTLMAYAGLKVNEVLSLEKKDVDLYNRRIKINNGRKRVIKICDKVVNAISEYLSEKNITGRWLFPGRGADGKFSRTQVFRICTNYSDKINPERLRHFYCENAMRQGQSLADIAAQAGYVDAHGALRGVVRQNLQKMESYRIVELD